MNLDLVVAQVRAYVPIFGGRVGGAVDYFRAKDQGFLDTPAAYVIPLGDVAADDRDQTDYQQQFTERLGIIVVLSNAGAVAAGDRRGQAASLLFDPIKWQLFKGLLNWRPTTNPGTIEDPDHFNRGLYYIEGLALEPDMARSFFQFNFGLDFVIGPDDVWQPGRDPLEGIDLRLLSESGTELARQDNDLWNANLREAGGKELREDEGFEVAEDTA